MIKRKFENFYFYCQSPRDFFHSLCLKRYLENKGFKNFYIIITKDDYSKHYDWTNFLKNFKVIYYINQCKIGALTGRLNLRGFLFFILVGLLRSFNTKKEFKKIKFKKNSLLISFMGFSLEKSIFMNFSNQKHNIKTLLISDDLEDAKISDFIYSIDGSIYYNLYQFFHSKKYIDLFWFKVEKKTSQREYRFRKQPSDYFFNGEFLLRNSKLKPDQLYWPIFSNDKKKYKEKVQVVLIGNMYYWEKLINIEPFYKRYNMYLDIIRSYHKNCDLIYINHPSTDEEKNFEINKLDLKYFKIIKNISCENYVYFNKQKTITFSIFSASTLILNQIGAKSFTLYKLFNDNEIDKKLINRLNHRWKIEKKHGKFHLTDEKEIKKIINNANKLKTTNFDNQLIKEYDHKLSFL